MFAVAVAEKTVQQLKLIATRRPRPRLDAAQQQRQRDAGQRAQAHRRCAAPLHVNAGSRPRCSSAIAAHAEVSGVAAAGEPGATRWRCGWPPANCCSRPADSTRSLRDTVSLNMLAAGLQGQRHPGKRRGRDRLSPAARNRPRRIRARGSRRASTDDRVKMEVTEISPPSGVAPLDNPFYRAVTHAVDRHVPGAGVFPLLMSGATDGRYWRMRGYAAYGFGPGILERARSWPRARHRRADLGRKTCCWGSRWRGTSSRSCASNEMIFEGRCVTFRVLCASE